MPFWRGGRETAVLPATRAGGGQPALTLLAALSAASYLALPVPRMASCTLPLAIWGSASSRMSTPRGGEWRHNKC